MCGGGRAGLEARGYNPEIAFRGQPLRSGLTPSVRSSTHANVPRPRSEWTGGRDAVSFVSVVYRLQPVVPSPVETERRALRPSASLSVASPTTSLSPAASAKSPPWLMTDEPPSPALPILKL